MELLNKGCKVTLHSVKYGALQIICIFWVLTIIAGTPPPLLGQPAGFSIEVTTLNVKMISGESKEETALRMKKIANEFKQEVWWNLIGLQELRAKANQFLPPWIGHIEFTAQDIPCYGRMTMPVRCFAAELYGSFETVAGQAGEIGFIANSAFFELVSGSVRSEHIGKKKNDVIWRRVVGARFRHKVTGYIIPFYSTHISNTDNPARLSSEISDLVAKVRSFHQPGDLTPVIVGDFNCHHWISKHRVAMNEHFMEVSEVNSIDQIYVGRPQSFPNAVGYLTKKPGTGRRVSEVYGPGLADHLATTVTLQFNPDQQAEEIPPPVPVPGKGCPQPVETCLISYGYGVGGWRVDKHPRMMADVNNDGRPDIVGFGNDAVYVSLSTGTSFSLPERWVYNYGYGASAGGWRIDKHLRMMADVDNDGMADIVGFGNDAVYVSRSTGTSFSLPERWVYSYGYSAGGWRVDKHPRMMADVNNDGRPDIVGFGNDAVYVSLSTGTGFSLPERWLYSYGYDASAGGWRVDKHPRMMADVNNDGMADIVGFGEDAVYVALSQGTTFGFAERWLYSYGYGASAGGWRVDRNPRMMADVNNDGMADIVGFGEDAVYVALSQGTTFGFAERWLYSYGYGVGGWRVDKHPRMMADVNNDGMADIVGFGNDAVYVSLSTGTSFSLPERWVYSYGYSVGRFGGWCVDKHPRMMADVNNDGRFDIVGFGYDGVYVTVSTW